MPYSTLSRAWLITLIEKLPKDFLPHPTYVSTHEVFFMKNTRFDSN